MIKEAIHSVNAPKAIGPYSPAVRIGDFIFLSGQIPIDPATGKIEAEDIKGQTRQVLNNMKAILAECGIDMNYILKTNVYLTDMNEFAAMNEVYAEYFEAPYPARCAAEVSKLAMGAKVEIEAYALDTRALEVLCCDTAACTNCSESNDCVNAE